MSLGYQSLLGIVALPAIAWALSEDRRRVKPRIVAVGLTVQILLGLLLLKAELARDLFQLLNGGVLALEAATQEGTAFVFGYLGGGPLPFDEPHPGAGFILAFRALPLVLVVSALSALLFHWNILPWIVRGFSWALTRTFRIGGALGLGAAMNIFVGMIESPLLIRPYLERMTRSELFALMSAGMATIAGTMMVIYASVLGGVIPEAMGHILTASVLSAPAALMIALVMVPESGEPTEGSLTAPGETRNAMEAVTRGTLDGVGLLINIIAMLVVLVALVSLANQILGLAPDVGAEPLTFQRILGWIMAPITWLMGVPWAEAQTAGALMGAKTILNEFVAYLQMTGLPEEALSPRSELIMTYALCGFANFGSLGIMIGGLTSMAPGRRAEIVGLGLKSLVSGTLATCLTGAVVGLIGYGG